MIASRPRAAGGRGSPMTRRRALVTAAGAVVTMLGAGTALGALLEPARRRARTFPLRAPDRPARSTARDRLPAIAGRPAEVTPAAEHYVVDIDLVDPALDTRDWALEIGGEVDRPLRLGVEALQRTFTLVEQISVLTCISNEVGGPLVGSSRWTGVRLADLLQRAEVRPGADAVVFRCADGYTSALRLEQARSAEVLVAIAQDGRPLTSAHGFPCRLRVPALYGMKNPKWLERIEVRRAPFTAYWVRRGWSDRAVVRTMARIDVASDATLGQATWIAGVAWAGVRGVSAVEVSLDAGHSWKRARLQAPLSPLAWTQWAYRSRHAHRPLPRHRRRRPHPGRPVTPSAPVRRQRLPRAAVPGQLRTVLAPKWRPIGDSAAALRPLDDQVGSPGMAEAGEHAQATGRCDVHGADIGRGPPRGPIAPTTCRSMYPLIVRPDRDRSMAR